MRNRKRAEQGMLATRFCELAGVATNRPCNLNDIPSFENLLDIDIFVVGAQQGNKFIRVPSRNDAESTRQRVYLYFDGSREGGHYHGIASITGLFRSSYFCKACLQLYCARRKHQCHVTCRVCKSENCKWSDTPLSCHACHMMCRSLDCFVRHNESKTGKNGRLAECALWWRCMPCKRALNVQKRSPEEHVCGEKFCKSCQEYVNNDHLCYHRALLPPGNVSFKYIFFDFECTQDGIMQCTEGYSAPRSKRSKDCRPLAEKCQSCKNCINCLTLSCGRPVHQPNLVVAQKLCNVCQKEPLAQKCDNCGNRCERCNVWDAEEGEFTNPPCADTCGNRETVFEGDDVQGKFGLYLFHPQHKGSTVLAHNMKGYDGYFILEHLISRSIYPDNIIYAGSKIMYMSVGRGLDIRIVDSLNFLPTETQPCPRHLP